MPWNQTSICEQRAALVDHVRSGRVTLAAAARASGVSRKTAYKWLRRQERSSGPLQDESRRPHHSPKKLAEPTDPIVRERVIALLHSPPRTHGINRISWRQADLLRLLGEQGCPMSRTCLSSIIDSLGYSWRKARVVLTSVDPEYRNKMDRIHAILQELGPDDRFFSIDEYGPFAVKKQGGRVLVGPGEQPTVPQLQRSKGCLIVTAALELSSNVITHFFSDTKNTAEMLRLMNVLLSEYANCHRLYLSCDAASWHVSKTLMDNVAQVNAKAASRSSPEVHLAPLPAGAQFANVIESVFSGMSRAIIHGSDYASVEGAKVAIDRYFAERNAHFRLHPRRAGQKIWGEERVASAFSEGQNCKDPRYR